MSYSTIFFDLDETLYPSGANLWRGITTRIEQYMRERLEIPEEKIPELRLRLFSEYGTTMRGLQITRGINTQDYLDYVHDVPLDDLSPNPALRAMLLELPMRRMIFTNADRGHADRVLKRLKLTGCFEIIIDILDTAPYCKPQAEAFDIALELSGETDPNRCILIDDSISNLETARHLGFLTFYAGPENQAPLNHMLIKDLTNLPLLLNNAAVHQNASQEQ
jgi:putative hydrolase of the HAD superfamily